MNKFTILFLVVFFKSFSAFSQSGIVEGKCVDRRGLVIENVVIGSRGNQTQVIYTNSKGLFSIEIEADKEIELVFRYGGLEEKRTVTVQKNEKLKLKDIKFDILSYEDVVVEGGTENRIGLYALPTLDVQNLPNNSIERMLVYTTAASSNNELTSNYNVRGGSYEENLVYVNGFLVNRPFLTRSGQQEGLSFINTALVQNVRFSAGGFDARYGDKLSSVLDIDYKNPDSLNTSLMASLLGIEAHVAHKTNSRFSYLFGARYRANGYLLNSLPTKGAYNPVFWDAQLLTNYNITEKLVWSNLIHFSSNNYRFAPETQETDFGTVNEAYRFKIYFEGQEQTKFLTMTGATSLKYTPNSKTNLDFYASVFNTNESENFDILGQYFINLLEKDPSKEEFGDSIATVGIGSFMNHARNQLKARIYNVYHNGSYKVNENHKLLWGVSYQYDQFDDKLSEWRLIDSAGYSIPQSYQTTGQLELYEVVKGKINLNNQKFTAFFQHNLEWNKRTENHIVKTHSSEKSKDRKKIKTEHIDTLKFAYQRFILQSGVRLGYTELNNEFYATPRINFAFFPRWYMLHNDKVVRRNAQFRVASGLYYQPPFYRELRTFDGQLKTDVRSQKSFHAVAGLDFNFNMWERNAPFKFSTEIYYKHLWDVNPYEVDNVRTRYYAENNAVAYAYGVDANVHGEFVKGIESFFKVGFLSTKEDILNDSYKEYYNAAGEKIIFGYSQDQTVVDSATIYPGYIPRPTDQLMNFAILFQDRMPTIEKLTAQLGLLYGTRLPYGPPDFVRYKDTLRQKSYFRVDLGISYDFMYGKPKKSTKFNRTFTDAILTFEVFNLMGINNVLSKQWIQDVEGKYYSIPNYLTQRRLNLKLILRI